MDTLKTPGIKKLYLLNMTSGPSKDTALAVQNVTLSPLRCPDETK